jgi:hypothetical protein
LIERQYHIVAHFISIAGKPPRRPHLQNRTRRQRKRIRHGVVILRPVLLCVGRCIWLGRILGRLRGLRLLLLIRLLRLLILWLLLLLILRLLLLLLILWLLRVLLG